MKFGRNFAIGKNHLTENENMTLCRVPLTNNRLYPPFEAQVIDENTTCELCLIVYRKQNKKVKVAK